MQHWIRVEMRTGVRVRRLGLGVSGGAHGPAALSVRAGSTFDDAALVPLAAVPCAPPPAPRERPPPHLQQIQLLADCKQVTYFSGRNLVNPYYIPIEQLDS